MGEKVNAFITYDDDELVGVNTPDDLALVEKAHPDVFNMLLQILEGFATLLLRILLTR